ncbi:MAG: type II toxin-antitoxin system VapC family toxin [Halothiobacillaceae bacterium]
MILVDLNVILDVLQARQPHYAASAEVLDRVLDGPVKGVVSAHAVTTIHYLVKRYRDASVAHEAVEWLMRHFEIAPIGRAQLLRAKSLRLTDFEDAVVAAAAESSGCEFIVTRNIKDFAGSPVHALTPDEYLATGCES